MSIGKRLKEARKRRRLSQKVVADHLGIHRTSIGKYENDETIPSLDKFVKLVDLYCTDSEYILFGITDYQLRFKDLPEVLIDEIYALVNAYYDSIETEE